MSHSHPHPFTITHSLSSPPIDLFFYSSTSPGYTFLSNLLTQKSSSMSSDTDGANGGSALPNTTSGGNSTTANGLPSPPSSPMDSKLPPSPPLSSVSLFYNTTAEPEPVDVDRLIESLNFLVRHNKTVSSLRSVSERCKAACKERDSLMRSTVRLQTENVALAEQVEKQKAKVQSVKTKTLETIKKATDKVTGLENDVQTKQASLDERNEELTKCKKDLAELEKKLNEARARGEVHKRAESAAVEAQSSLKKDMEKLQVSFAEDKDKFQKGTVELEEMRAYYFPTKTMAPAEIGRLLDGIFDSAYNVVYACFSQDLSEDHFAKSEPGQDKTAATATRAWDKFTSRIQDGLPGISLPASNTPAAKTMRIVAVMRFLGLLATTELFQPVYICDQGEDFSNILARVKDPKLAEAARRVLLQVLATTRDVDGDEDEDDADDDDDEESDVEEEGDGDEEKPLSKVRADSVVQEVLEVVGGLLSPPQKKSFCTELFQWSYETARIWEDTLQPLEQRIIARALPEIVDDDSSLWSALVYPSSPPSASRTASFSGQRPPAARRGSMSVGSPPSLLARPMLPPPKAVATATAATAVSTVELADVSIDIWPVFTLADEKETVVKRGLVVTKKQVAPALEEIQHTQSPRRMHRQLRRASSMVRSPRRQSTAPAFLDISPAN
ncbi:mei5 protein [Ophiostoma piceae UAMH 11346]|uniref:Mei5 protein n=1 Tax=Ophiostoma piceae (strain UAMH 11346) TaxID=1262450 RepID=S3BXK5_OPHP1|nr:mei5 protein [Ophiostoma piceae UAMH 11346]